MNAKVTVRANVNIEHGGKVIVPAGKRIEVTLSGDGKSYYVPNGKGGSVVKPVGFFTPIGGEKRENHG